MNPLTIILAFSICLLTQSIGFGETINSKVVKYLQSQVGQRIGGGECAHAANEALRVGGAEFLNSIIGPDDPEPGDYVWGTLQKKVSNTDGQWTDSSPETKLLAGDVIQYRNTTFVYPIRATESGRTTGSRTVSAPHHTSIIAEVNESGSATSVFEQNYDNVRVLEKHPIDLTALKEGEVRVYRPKVRVNAAGKYKYSVVNNTTNAQAVAVAIGQGKNVGMIQFTPANTANSYVTGWNSTNGNDRFKLVLANGVSITVANGAAYEIFTKPDGQDSFRKLTP